MATKLKQKRVNTLFVEADDKFDIDGTDEMFAAFNDDSGKLTFKMKEEEKLNENSSLDLCFHRYIQHHTAIGSAKATIHGYECCYYRMLEFICAQTGQSKATKYPLLLITHPSFLEKYRKWMEKENYKESTIGSAMRCYRAFYYWCAEQGWIAEKKIKIKLHEDEIKPLIPKDRLESILRKPSVDDFIEYRNWVICVWALNTGNRIGSIANIKMKDIDLEDCWVLVNVVKNKKPQRLAVPVKVIKIVKEYIKHWRDSASPEDYLFCNIYGEHMTEGKLSQSVSDYMRKRYGKGAPERLGAHALRHYFAASYMMSGGNAFQLQKQLGHSTLYQTKRYAEHFSVPIQSELEKHAPINTMPTKTGRKKMKKSSD